MGVLLLAITALFACKSAETRLDSMLRTGQYEAARALLDDLKVGASVAADADEEDLKLRATFASAIDAATLGDAERLIGQGKPRAARQMAHDRLALCPWSLQLQSLAVRCDALIARIAEVEGRWEHAFAGGSIEATNARKYFNELKPDRPWIVDSEKLTAWAVVATSAIVDEWASRLEACEGRVEKQDLDVLHAELADAGIAATESDALTSSIELLRSLPSLGTESTPLTDLTWLATLDRARALWGQTGGRAGTTPLEACHQALKRSFARWYAERFCVLLDAPNVPFALVNAAEQWEDTSVSGDAGRLALAKGHVQIAGRRAREGTAAALAMLHLRRAASLGLGDSDEGFRAVRALAVATRATTPTPSYRLAVDVDPKVEPEIYDLVDIAFLRGFLSADDALAKFDVLLEDDASPLLSVNVVSAELVADTSSLRDVRSKYFSHFEEVVNPRKQTLKNQVANAKWSMDSKWRSYEYAVSSHNINPTAYSLDYANDAYTSYSIAVDNYNSLINSYNATPATVTEPVYIAYTFQQGNVRFGWRASVRVQVNGGESRTISRESVESDFVRIGSKHTDDVESYRREDDLDIDMTGANGLRHLSVVVASIRDDVNVAAGRLATEPLAALDSTEIAILGWLYHPWGVQSKLATTLGVPIWAASAGTAMALRRLDVTPPTIRIPMDGSVGQGALSAESAATDLSKFVCKTSSGRSGRVSALGTGTLIGPDGLVLTCAHVLVGPELTLEFKAGPWKGSYSAEVVFANAERDVAIVRAKGMTNVQWAQVRLGAAARKGEPIVAIGNPSMIGGIVNEAGISQGIVSNPSVEQHGDSYVAADIAIASGSSGGALFSLVDGAVVGVIQLVANTPSLAVFGERRASSGYSCLGAPSDKLTEWVGLTLD
jgi:hypothetical protein